MLRAAEKREERDAKRALRRQLKAERRARHQVTAAGDSLISAGSDSPRERPLLVARNVQEDAGPPPRRAVVG